MAKKIEFSFMFYTHDITKNTWEYNEKKFRWINFLNEH